MPVVVFGKGQRVFDSASQVGNLGRRFVEIIDQLFIKMFCDPISYGRSTFVQL